MRQNESNIDIEDIAVLGGVDLARVNPGDSNHLIVGESGRVDEGVREVVLSDVGRGQIPVVGPVPKQPAVVEWVENVAISDHRQVDNVSLFNHLYLGRHRQPGDGHCNMMTSRHAPHTDPYIGARQWR